MKHILLVEDDPYKETGLRRAMLEIVGDMELRLATSVQTAVAAVRSIVFDLVILDMALPSHDRSLGKGNPRQMPSGGLEVLLNLNEKRRVDPVIIVTQYPEIEVNGQLIPINQVPDVLLGFVDVSLRGIVLYDEFAPEWREQFQTIVRGCFD
ncbi:response regulator [Agrobacterium rhizogenes]|uniref:response regulator n=1 Tax=Rhizobium rhizogenes TaxID=359 RepID=UPI00115C9E70|nr:response regulator [Rhizobium rhizogenes]NTG38731.1 response regulator [Rhizobium rhizogenes]NTG58538.1 response regulator [Rhizobium rhizogenes]NTI06463.1 response regulator [Rhizobium rhizogenes]NTI13274.1 response regulator [Rhizobium rhizogenes]TRB15190.1 response regulator [Rhizobium rhizogenes]